MSAEITLPVGQQNQNIVRLATAQALAGANSVVFYATGAIVGNAIAPSPTLATLPITIFVLGMAACILPFGALARRCGRKTVFMVGTGAGMLTGLLAATAVVWCLCFNGFHAVSISPAVARSKGLRVGLLDNLFVVLIAVVVMLAIRWVGLLLINAMLILPAAASRHVARSMRSYHLLALIFGLFAGVLGLLLSYYNGVATGPTIILVQAVIFFGTFLMREK